MRRAGEGESTQRRRRRWPQVQKWIRRAHMYAGLALVPWVLLYGVTALLFNHSSWMSGTSVSAITSKDFEGTKLANLTTAPGIAGEVVAEFARAASEGERELEYVEGSARWSGSFSLSGTSEEERVRLSIDPRLRGGTLRRSALTDAGSESFSWAADFDESRIARARGLAHDELEDAARAIAAEHRLSLEEIRVRRWPSVRFLLEEDGELLRCRVSLGGEVEVERDTTPATLRQKLLRLHLQHGDPGYAGVRSTWALVVDATGVAMVFWALSGIVMWWSIRKTRRAGLVALLIGCGAMGLLAVLVWSATGLA